MKKIIFILPILIAILNFSCQKGEQGDVGPNGIAGTKGPTGDRGEIGLSDSKGMIISEWIDVKRASWNLYSGTTNLYGNLLTFNKLTTALATKGGFYVYMQIKGLSTTYQLPVVDDFPKHRIYASIWNPTTNPQVLLNIEYNQTFSVVYDYKFRVVFVPAGARVSAKVDWQNYESVKKYLNLND